MACPRARGGGFTLGADGIKLAHFVRAFRAEGRFEMAMRQQGMAGVGRACPKTSPSDGVEVMKKLLRSFTLNGFYCRLIVVSFVVLTEVGLS